jgi:hypothetical protein
MLSFSLVNTVKNFQFPQKTGKFLANTAALSFLRKTAVFVQSNAKALVQQHSCMEELSNSNPFLTVLDSDKTTLSGMWYHAI